MTKKGSRLTDETRERMSRSRILLWRNPSYRKKCSDSRRKLWRNPSYRAKSIHPQSDETRKKIGDAHRGMKHGPLSPSTRSKLSMIRRGKVKSIDHQENIRRAKLGDILVNKFPRHLTQKHKQRRSYLRKYGLTEELFDALLFSQAGSCAICAIDSPPTRWWCVDHCHKTGKVRGILCHNCNSMLGHAKDSIDTLLRGAAYLKNATT